jgi:hypothetical protein
LVISDEDCDGIEKIKKTNKNFIGNLTCHRTKLQMKISLENLNQLKSNSSPPFSSSIFYIKKTTTHPYTFSSKFGHPYHKFSH